MTPEQRAAVERSKLLLEGMGQRTLSLVLTTLTALVSAPDHDAFVARLAESEANIGREMFEVVMQVYSDPLSISKDYQVLSSLLEQPA